MILTHNNSQRQLLFMAWLLGRKRRASEDEEMTIADVLVDHPSNQPISSAGTTATMGATLLDRRHLETGRFMKRNRATIHKQFPISKLLGKSCAKHWHGGYPLKPNLCTAATLEKDKLVELINDLVDANPHLQPEIDAHVPAPTTQSVSALISNLETKLNDSYPPHRPGKNRDDYSFHRVKASLMEIVVSQYWIWGHIYTMQVIMAPCFIRTPFLSTQTTSLRAPNIPPPYFRTSTLLPVLHTAYLTGTMTVRGLQR